MPAPQITIPMWLALPQDVRQQLKEVFNIPRSEGSHIIDNEVVSDGHSHYDLSRIDVDAMQQFTGSKEKDFFALFELTLRKLEAAKEPAPVVEAPKVVETPKVKEVAPEEPKPVTKTKKK